MIPDFPQFKRLSIEDGPEIDQYTRQFPAYSNYTFANLWAWDIRGATGLSMLNGNLVVKFADYITGDPLYSFLGNQRVDATACTLLDFSEAAGLPAELHFVPEICVSGMTNTLTNATEDAAQFDYVYLANQISALSGGAYKSRRYAARAFEERHPNYGFEVMSLESPMAQHAVREITNLWKTQWTVRSAHSGVEHELQAIERMLALSPERGLLVGLVMTDARPTSYTLEERCNAATSLSHFSKAATRERGEPEYLNRQMASHLLHQGVTHLNWEEDLGLESLRATKTSYRPAFFMKNFVVTRAAPRASLMPVRPRSIKPPAHTANI